MGNINIFTFKRWGAHLGICLMFILTMPALANAATPTQIVGGDPLDRTYPANLVQNGSFEDNPVGDCGGYWASATNNTPMITIPNWTDTGGGTATYATLACGGNHQPATNYDAVNYIYFGNGVPAIIDQDPATITPTNGQYIFPTLPVLGIDPTRPEYGTKGIALNQDLTLTAGNKYQISFWASGEESNTGKTYASDGIFEFAISGFDPVYLATPKLGSTVYTFEFIAPESTVNIKFTNWGHFTIGTSGWNFPPAPDLKGYTTELILDDVIVNEVPNNPPTLNLSATSQTSCSAKDSIVASSNGIDSDGDALTYTLKTSNPEYFVIDSSTGLVTLAQANIPAGTYTLEVEVTDGMATIPENIDVVIVDGNPCVVTGGVTTPPTVPASTPTPAPKELASTGHSFVNVVAVAASTLVLGFGVFRLKKF